MFDYLAAGESLDEFLAGFPSVRKERALAVLQAAQTALLPTHLTVEPAQLNFFFAQATSHEAAA